MNRIKNRSAKIVGIRPSVLFSFETYEQRCTSGLHVERNCEWVKPRGPKIFKIGHSPARQLYPNHVNMELQVIYRKTEGKN